MAAVSKPPTITIIAEMSSPIIPSKMPIIIISITGMIQIKQKVKANVAKTVAVGITTMTKVKVHSKSLALSFPDVTAGIVFESEALS